MVAGLGKSLNAFLAANFSDIGQEALTRAARAAKANATAPYASGSGGAESFTAPRGGYDGRPRYFRDYAHAPNDLRPSEELAVFGLPTDEVGEAFPAPMPAAEELVFVEGEDGVFRPSLSIAEADREMTGSSAASASFTKATDTSAASPQSPLTSVTAMYQRSAALLTATTISTYAFAA